MSYTRRNTTDGSTIMNKDLYDNLQDGIEERGVTPEMFGAVGDGVTDDSDALNQAFNSSDTVTLGSSKVYRIKNGLKVYRENFSLIGNNSTILVDSLFDPQSDDRYGVIRLQNTNRVFKGEGVTLKISTNIEFTFDYTLYGIYGVRYSKGGVGQVFLKKFNIVFEELDLSETSHRQCFTFGGNFLSMEQCKLINKTKSKEGGCLWIDSDEEQCLVDIRNCEFINHSSDEIFASYGSGEKYITVCNSYFIQNIEYLKKNTIMMAFYEGANFVSFENCLIKEYGDNSSYELSNLIRGGDTKGREVSLSFCRCNIHSEIKTGIFTTTNTTPTGNFHIRVTDSYIENTLGAIIGSWTPYMNNDGQALSATDCIMEHCKVKTMYALAEGSNNTKDVYKATIKDCIIIIEHAKRVFYSYYNNNMMVVLENSFIESDVDNIPVIETRNVSITENSHFYKAFSVIKNSFLNAVEIENS